MATTGPPPPALAAGALAAWALDAARGLVADALCCDATDAPSFAPDDLQRWIEGRPEGREALDRAVTDSLPPDAAWTVRPSDGARGRRLERAAALAEAVAGLRLCGALAGDGPGRLTLPGWGRHTRRAARTLLREGPAAPRWEAHVAGAPLAELGDHVPMVATPAAADPRLRHLALALRVAEGRRQEVRDALLTTAARMVSAMDRGRTDSARVLEEDCVRLAAAVERLDAEIGALWDRGAALAAA